MTGSEGEVDSCLQDLMSSKGRNKEERRVATGVQLRLPRSRSPPVVTYLQSDPASSLRWPNAPKSSTVFPDLRSPGQGANPLTCEAAEDKVGWPADRRCLPLIGSGSRSGPMGARGSLAVTNEKRVRLPGGGASARS